MAAGNSITKNVMLQIKIVILKGPLVTNGSSTSNKLASKLFGMARKY